MKKVRVTLYEISKKELRNLPLNTQVLVFNAFKDSYTVYPSQDIANISDTYNYFFLFDNE